MLARAAVFLGPGRPFELREYPIPDPAPGAILVKIRLANICGSDLHQWRGDGTVNLPPGGKVSGHEMVGEVSRLGTGVSTDSLGDPLKEGDRVVYPYFYPCRRCWACTAGYFSLCTHRLDHYQESADTWPHFNGGFAEYYYLRPGHFVFRVPDEVPDEVAASANCAVSQVIHALQQARFGLGDTLVVQGAGALGVFAISVAREMGAEQIIAVDALPFRLELARQFGADAVIGLDEYQTPESRVARVRELTGGHGARVVMEAVGMPSVVAEGLEMVRSGGTYLEVGMVTGKFSTEFFPSKLLRANASYVGVNQYEPIILAEALRFLRRARARYPFNKMSSHRFPLHKIEEAFEQSEWTDRQSSQFAASRVAIDPSLRSDSKSVTIR